MKNILRSASENTQSVFDAAYSPFRGGNGALGLAFMPVVLGVTATAFIGFLATETGAAILGEIRRRGRLRAPHPESPSLRGTPTARELKADGAISPRTLAVRLRMGSRLADLEPTLDSGNLYRESPTGAKRIQSRGRGLRGYIADNHLGVSYSSLMRYRSSRSASASCCSSMTASPSNGSCPAKPPGAISPPISAPGTRRPAAISRGFCAGIGISTASASTSMRSWASRNS